MRKIIIIAATILILILLSVNAYAKTIVLNYDGLDHKYNGITYKLSVNGKTVTSEVPPVNLNKSRMVSVRAVFESLGGTLKWDSAQGKFYITLGTSKLEFKSNSSSVKLNEKTVKMETAAKLVNGRLLIPVSFFNNFLNLKVSVSEDKGTITIDNKPNPPAETVTSKPDQGLLDSIKYVLNQNQCEVDINLTSYKDYKAYTIANPDRIVIDISNVQLKSILPNINIKSDFLKSVRCSQYDSQTARVVLDITGKTSYAVLKKDGMLSVNVTGSDIKTADRGDPEVRDNPDENKLDVKYVQNSDNDEVSILVNNYKGYNIVYDENVNRIILRIPGMKMPPDKKIYTFNGKLVQSVLASRVDSNTAILGIYLNVKSQYQVFEDAGKLTIQIVQVMESKDLESGNPPAGESGNTNPDQPVPGFDIKFNSVNGNDEVSLIMDNYSNYKVSTMDGPNRIIIDIPFTGAQRSEKVLNINSNFVNDARYAQYTDNSLRVVLDVTGQPDYEVIENKGQLIIRVKSCKYKNISYQNSGDRVCFIISNSKLSDGGKDNKKLFDDSYDETGKRYTIAFPSGQANLDSGFVKINDNVLDSIEISKDSIKTYITFNAKDRFTYNVFSRSELKDTTITILRPAASGERLVVIDPGHGGNEPGAISGNVNEKDLNLDISLRLNALLKSNNIKTYILRSDDTYLGLYERTTIANSLNASLFICIHNNAFNSSEKGTETLYNFAGADNGSFNSKKFAQMIQTNLVKTLGSLDRKIVYRPNLVVLKGTNMPAALAEVGFITNNEERARLLTEDYRQKAASAICNSIIQSLSVMNQ